MYYVCTIIYVSSEFFLKAKKIGKKTENQNRWNLGEPILIYVVDLVRDFFNHVHIQVSNWATILARGMKSWMEIGRNLKNFKPNKFLNLINYPRGKDEVWYNWLKYFWMANPKFFIRIDQIKAVKRCRSGSFLENILLCSKLSVRYRKWEIMIEVDRTPS